MNRKGGREGGREGERVKKGGWVGGWEGDQRDLAGRKPEDARSFKRDGCEAGGGTGANA